MSAMTVSAEPCKDESSPADDTVMNNARVYVIAKKYDLPRLKEQAKARFFTQIPGLRGGTFIAFSTDFAHKRATGPSNNGVE